MKKRKTTPIAYTLEPGQSLSQYKALEAKWYSKIRASTDFHDIEFLDMRGYTSPYTRDYSLARLRSEFNEATLEHYRRASIFLHDFTWPSEGFNGISTEMAQFIWAHYAAGLTLREIVKALNGTGEALEGAKRPRRRNKRGRLMVHPSLFWVHLKLSTVLLPLFEAWAAANKDKFIVDWSLE